MDTSERNEPGIFLENDLLEMFKSKLYTDVKIQVKSKEETKSFDAHALIIATRSPILADLLYKTGKTSIALEDVSIRGFENLLWYIYSNTLSWDCPEELIKVSKAARRLQVGGVTIACKYKLAKCHVDINNVCAMFKASKYFKMENISTKCIKFVQSIPESEFFESPGFQNASKETISTILALRTFSKQTSLPATIQWLQKHNVRDRDLLSNFGIELLSSEGFLNLIERFPSYFTFREVACILSNILRPGILELPPWCKVEGNIPMGEVSSHVYEEIIENAIQVKTECNRRFPRSHFLERDDFKGSVVFEIKLTNSFINHTDLVMLELAFGSSYAPINNLQLELFQYDICAPNEKMRKPFALKGTREHYYLILKQKIRFSENHPLVFCLNLRTFGLRRWGDDSPVSDGKYRAVQIPGDIFHNMGFKAFGQKSVCLTFLSDWLVFLDPIQQEKRLLLTSFYFGSPT